MFPFYRFRWPCVSARASCKQYKAHVGPVAKCRWSMGDSHLLTIGEDDKAILVWRHEVDDMAFEEPDFEEDAEIDLNTELNFFVPKAQRNISAKAYSRPWLSSIVEPTIKAPLSTSSPPSRRLELVHIHGYQSKSNNNDLVYNCQGEIIFASSSICIIYDRDNHSQRYFRKHNAQISCFAISPSRRMIASADFSRCCKLKVWDAQTCHEISTLDDGYHKKGIIYLAFAADSKRIVTVGAEDNQIICVWYSLSAEWDDGAFEASAICLNENETVLFAEFIEQEQSPYVIATGGVNHMKFWSINSIDLIPSLAIYESIGSKQHMTCGTSCWNKFVTGTESSELYIWAGRSLTKVISKKIVQGTITSIHFCKIGLVTGCDDGCVRIWSDKFHQTKSLQISALDCSIKSIDSCLDSSQKSIITLLIGTNSSEIFEVATESGNIKQLHESHYSGEIWGLAMHPILDDVYCTCADDCTIRIWSYASKSLSKRIDTEKSLRAITWSNDGKHLIVGCGDGDCDKEEKTSEEDGTVRYHSKYDK